MRYSILNRFTEKLQFTAEFTCFDSESRNLKRGLALKWAVENKVDVRDCDFTGAYITNLDFSGVDLSYSDMGWAYLYGVDFSGANLSGANLRRADLGYANLTGANLESANLCDAVLSGAKLYGANLSGAKLSNLSGFRSELLKTDIKDVVLWGDYPTGMDYPENYHEDDYEDDCDDASGGWL